MNKYIVDDELELAHMALKEAGIATLNKDKVMSIDSGFRGQISSFGAAIMGGSVCSAIAFFSKQQGAAVDRSKLLKAIHYILKEKKIIDSKEDLFQYAVNPKNKEKAKEDILNATIALKLAMNLYHIEEKKKDVNNNGSKEE